MVFKFAVFGNGEHNVRSPGEVVWVNADQTAHKSAPLPAELRERVAKKENLAEPAA
jgi:acyl-CoA thioesterase FadM